MTALAFERPEQLAGGEMGLHTASRRMSSIAKISTDIATLISMGQLRTKLKILPGIICAGTGHEVDELSVANQSASQEKCIRSQEVTLRTQKWTQGHTVDLYTLFTSHDLTYLELECI
jgi:hypothetical protein